MSLHVGSSGQIFRYATPFNMSAFTQLDLHFTAPDGTTFTVSSSDSRVSAPAVAVTDDDLGGLDAYTYMQFLNEVTDFTQAGTYSVCGVFTNTNTTPDQIYPGSTATFEVLPPCPK